MADNITDAEERRILDDSLGGTVYLALFTVAPADDGAGGTEVSGNAYARQALTLGAAATVAGASTKKNTAEVVYPIPTGNWGTIVAAAAMTALTGGAMRWRVDLTPIAITAPVQPRFAIGDLSFGLS
ncbi:hypothetical protein PAI11_37690 [Patulibacter medicamentivorans]|uniref:Phage protein n=1 Tax=Patulibacter medicamentivorans TaxID=1097667 RepID=H0EA95_9ACTN|nr:hypothetical protein [Patulibacter medicamentivorans]EHN09435.1 hypothetical protein PAI11_37690 [Patulibacter medicamentivorans]